MEDNVKSTEELRNDSTCDVPAEQTEVATDNTMDTHVTKPHVSVAQMLDMGMAAVKAVSMPLESSTTSPEAPTRVLVNPAQLKVFEDDIWAIDHREIYRRGFTTLTSDEKDTVLVSLLIQNGAPNAQNLTPEEAIIAKQTEHTVWKDRQEFNFKKLVWYASVVVGIVVILSIVYFASRTGVLTDAGNFNSILNTIGAIYQQLFGPIPTVSR